MDKYTGIRFFGGAMGDNREMTVNFYLDVLSLSLGSERGFIMYADDATTLANALHDWVAAHEARKRRGS